MKVRGYALFVAVLLAAAATGAVYLYVQGVRHQTVKTPSGMVTVIVPKQDITVGTPLDKLIDAGGFTTVVVVPDARVLAVANPSGSGGVLNTNASGNSIVMLSLTPKDAARVILAQEQGHVWLSLLPPNQQGVAIPPVSIEQLTK